MSIVRSIARNVIRPIVRAIVRGVADGNAIIANRWVGQGDGTRYINDFEHTFVADFDYEFIWQRMDRTGTAGTALLGSTGDQSSVFQVNDSGNVSFPDNVIIRVLGSNKGITAGMAGVAQGKYVKLKLKRRGTATELSIDGLSKGNFAGDSSGDWTIANIGAVNGSSPFNSVIADVKWTDYAELPKGTYLKGDGTAYTQVNIPVEAGDVIEFDYAHASVAANQSLFGASENSAPLFIDASNQMQIVEGRLSGTVNGVVIVDGVPLSAGEKYHFVLSALANLTVTNLLSNAIAAALLEGTITNFTVNGTEYIYPLKAPYITDKADGTAIALQIGSVAEFGSDRWSDGVVASLPPVTTYFPPTTSPAVIGKAYIWEGLGLGVKAYKGTGFSVENGEIFIATETNLRLRNLSTVTASGDFTPTLRETSNGLIPVFDAATNLVDYASNVVSYPIDEQDGVDLFTLGTVEAGITDNGDGTFTCDGTQTTTLSIISTVSAVAGRQYKSVFTVYEISAGNAKSRLGAVNGNIVTTPTIDDTSFITAISSTTIEVEVSANFVGTFGTPVVQEVNLNVLAYDENGARYSSQDALWTPDADHVFLPAQSTNSGAIIEEGIDMSNAITRTVTLADGVTGNYGTDGGSGTIEKSLPGFDHHRITVLSGSADIAATAVNGTETAIASGNSSSAIYDLSHTSFFSFTATGSTVIEITSY